MENFKKRTFREICEEKCKAKEEFVELLHETTGVSLSTVYRWVSGFSVPSRRDRIAIANKLGSTTEVLFGK